MYISYKNEGAPIVSIKFEIMNPQGHYIYPTNVNEDVYQLQDYGHYNSTWYDSYWVGDGYYNINPENKHTWEKIDPNYIDGGDLNITAKAIYKITV